MTQFDFSVILRALPLLLGGLKYTLLISAAGIAGGFLLGTITGILLTSRNKALGRLALLYVEAIRGTPLMVQVMFIYFGLPLLTGVRIVPLAAGIGAIAINAGAYIAEIVRGAIQSIDKGQTEAGLSLGMTRFQVLAHIIWPQALRRMIPPLGNQFIISIKDTSLLVVIGVGELTRQGQEIIAVNFRAFEIWLTVAIMYLAVTTIVSRLLRLMEKRWRIIQS